MTLLQCPPSWHLSVLVTFLVAVIKYKTRSYVRKNLSWLFERIQTLWWGSHDSRWLYDLGAYNSSSHLTYSQETDKGDCWYSAGLLIFLFSLLETLVLRMKSVNLLRNSSLEIFSQKCPKVCSLRNLRSF